MNFYVYYKLEPESATSLRPLVQALFERARAKFGVQGRWMRRRDDPGTYMEVYEGVTDDRGFEAFLQREGAAISRERKVERFISA